ncbi:type II toxin-antitoxin system RelE/ParE family toxin [Variovorax robiniae]|uniref:Type II toxin-antitoxin system RelE/ParE family toxin n=1 Tax=Variovorax robiniae TaxID=1836199 RepID=A0ABU8X6D7_9BURK
MTPVHDIELLPSAQADLQTGFWFYEMQADRLGDYFLDCLIADIESLRLFAGIHPRSHGDFHRTLSKRFPFAIYYEVVDDVAIVTAVLDCRQNPASIRARLQDR